VAHYTSADDGKVIDGRIIVWMAPRDRGAEPGAATAAGRAKATAAALRAASAAAVPFCEECTAAAGSKRG
jgi:hypothetical protein